MSNLFDKAINKFLTEAFKTSVYEPHERIEDHVKFKSTLEHIGCGCEDEELVDKHFKTYKGRTMAEAIKELADKKEEPTGSGGANQQATTHQGKYGSEDPLRGQIKIRPQEVYNQGSN